MLSRYLIVKTVSQDTVRDNIIFHNVSQFLLCNKCKYSKSKVGDFIKHIFGTPLLIHSAFITEYKWVVYLNILVYSNTDVNDV